MKQTVEEAAREAIHKHYNCNGEYSCGERNYCEHFKGSNSAFDCGECGADEFKEGFIAGAEWYRNHLANIPWDEAMQEIVGVESNARKSPWRNTTEKPVQGKLCLVEYKDPDGETRVRLDKHCGMEWKEMCHYDKILLWAYVDDLLPKGGVE